MDVNKKNNNQILTPLKKIMQWCEKSQLEEKLHGSTWHRRMLKYTPKLLKPGLTLIPFSWQERLIIPVLHKVFAEAIEEEAFACLEDQWLKLSIIDLDIHWLFSIHHNHFVMKNATQKSASDVSFSANGNDLLLIAARHEDPDTLFFQRRLLIEGNTALGLEIKNLIDSIDTSELPQLFNQTLQTSAKWLAPV